MAFELEKFETYVTDIFGSDFCRADIKKVIKADGEYDSILELSVAASTDSDRAGEIIVCFEELLKYAPLFAKAYGKVVKTDRTFLIWLSFRDIKPDDLVQRIELFCYNLDPDAEPISVSALKDLDIDYNCKLQK